MITGLLFSILLAQTGFANEITPPAQVKSCVACHDIDGGAADDDSIPKIASLGDTYFRKELSAFSKKLRHENMAPMMYTVISPSTKDSDLDIIVAYFAQQNQKPSTAADSALAAKGKIIYEQGLPAKGVMPCTACHGDKGLADFNIPRIAGQNIGYQLAQFEAYTKQTRQDLDSKMMTKMILNLSIDELTALANYINSL